jgi:ABC-type phosphate transport system substrate-binding protein
MTSLSARRLVPTCILSAVTVAALVAPGAASAAGKLGTQCSGSTVTGQGSSLQKLAQQTVWNPDFNISGNSHACNGTQGTKAKPEVKYTSTGSGLGLESWGVNGTVPNYEASNAFVSTDEPPNSTQIGEIDAHGAVETLQTIPVLQGAVAVIVNLPEGCTPSSKSAFAGRLVLNNVTLEKIFRGTITKWSEITDSGDKFTGKTCNAETPIKRVVRLDQSGTTHIFKKYLSVINSAAFETEKAENKTWTEVSEGTENKTWPKAAEVVRPEKTGGGALVAKVAETPSSIGYANLADARSNKSFTPPLGGGSKARFWAAIQNDGLGTSGTLTYADPSSNGDKEALANANCVGEQYANGENPFPPPSVLESWNEVTTKVTEKNYTLCGLTYTLAFTEYSKYAGTSLEEVTTVNNFLRFVLGTGTAKGSEAGQVLILNHDYLNLPSGPVLTDAQKGAENVKF